MLIGDGSSRDHVGGLHEIGQSRLQMRHQPPVVAAIAGEPQNRLIKPFILATRPQASDASRFATKVN
jgi:hypothetical protein